MIAVFVCVSGFIAVSCQNPLAPQGFATLDDLIEGVCDPGGRVSMDDLDSLINAHSGPATGRVVLRAPVGKDFPYDEVGKWVFCDYYCDTLDGIEGSLTTNPVVFTNDWGAPDVWDRPEERSQESCREILGADDSAIAAIFHVTDEADPYDGKYHVYRYLPYREDGVYDRNVWFGNGHVFYFNPVGSAGTAPGAPALEVFPDIVTNEILELRFDGTSYYEYRGIHAGADQVSVDPGSTAAELFATLGEPVETVVKDDIEGSDWDARNTYFLFTGLHWGYIHYQNRRVNVRIFLVHSDDPNDPTMYVKGMYFVKE